MAVTGTLSNHFKYQLAAGVINFSSQSFKALLMREGFTFNKDDHAKRINVKGTITGSSNITFAASTKKITKSSGFLAAGFVAGNKLTISGTSSNNGTKTIVTASDTEIVVSETLVDESNTSATITADDEITTGNGYTQDTKTLTTVALNEDDTNDRCEITWDAVEWTASAGSIGPTDGCLIYDDTASDDTVVGYLSFGETVTISAGNMLSLQNNKLRLT